MPAFRVNQLPTETKRVHESQNIWRKKNWEKTFADHKDDIERMIQKLNLFDIWSNKLQKISAAKTLIPEIFMDAYISIHFASYGLYKYANMCLRSELETALRLIFFSKHEVEFDWWLEGDEWYRERQNYPDVWGRSYTYFQNLKPIKDFERACADHMKLFSGDAKISNVYKKLSKSIHSSAKHFQTRPDRVSPRYDLEELKRWIDVYIGIQTYIQILLSLSFADEFKDLKKGERKKILEKGIEEYYRERVKQALGITE